MADVESIVEQLTEEEKVRVCHGAMPFWRGLIDLGALDCYHKRPFPSGAVARLGVPGVAFVDGPRGIVLEGGATTFPVAMARGASWNPALEERIGDAIGKELRSHGGTLFGGVCINLLRHPAWGRAQETYGEDPVGLGAMGAALVRGVERHAMACIKHFALNSIENARFQVDVQCDERVLHELYLPHFKQCVEAGATAVMSAYNAVNGTFCGENPHLLTDILVSRWGFEGFVLTDFVFGLRDGVAAMNAGQHLEMPFHMAFAEQLPSDELQPGRLDDAVRRLVRAQLAVPDGDYPASLRACDDHRALARASATQSIVMLQNRDQVLPLDPTRPLALIGRLADRPNLGDRGSSDTRPEHVVTPRMGLEAASDAITYDDGRDLDRAAAVAAEADAALVVVGLTHRQEGEHIVPPDLSVIAPLIPLPWPRWLGKEALRPTWSRFMDWGTRRLSRRLQGRAIGSSFGVGGDRSDLGLLAEDVALIRRVAEANPRTIVAVMAGSAVDMPWRDAVPAVLMLWYPGMEGGHALADILFGAVSPSGRMPFTTTAHLPPFDPDARQIRYDLWHGYRLLDRDGVSAEVPFGFGLSYAELRWDDLRVQVSGDQLTVEVTVQNHSDIDASDVVFVFVSPPAQAVTRPSKELRGFARVDVPARGQVDARIDIPLERLGYWGDGFVNEPGGHVVIVARHAEDEGLRRTIELPGG